MLYITERDPSGAVNGYPWFIGERRLPIRTGRVFELQANGPELEYIRQHVTGVPFTDSSVVIWHGDHARFVSQLVCQP